MTMPSVAEQAVDELELPEGIEVPPPPCVFGAGGKGDPRLMITHIVNYNFKSYAGKQVLGPFHKCFTGIVGPNGSGKSNVIDSMLFVFGYRANKIRSKKLSVLIHNSENHKSATSCSVEVHFEKIVDLDNGGYCTVPNSAFSVSRTATADNTSQYYINGKRKQFKDVAALLQTSGIDLNHNRFLILQGEVEQIALMKPKAVNEHGDGMLEYLEDIIGSSRFKDAIGKLSKDIEDLDEERKDKLSRVKVVEKDKEQLEPLRNEALDFLRKQNTRTVLQNHLLQVYINTFKKESEQQKQKMDEMKAEVDEAESEVKQSKEAKKGKVRECAKLAKSFEQASALHTEKKDEMRELEKKNVKVFEDRKHRKSKLKELNKKLEKETKKLSDLRQQPEKIDDEVADLTEERAELTKAKKKSEQSMNSVMETLRDDTKHLQKEKEELETVLLEKMKFVNEAKGQWDIAEETLQLFIANVKRAEHALEQCKKKLTDMTQAEKCAVDEMSSLERSCPEIEQKIESVRKSLKELKVKEAKLESVVRERRASLAEVRHNASSNRSRGAVTKFLLQLKNSGKLPGIFGRLGDLGGIDEKYDVAISSCCPALENILVDNIETAQECVQALKKNQIGQATFIALDKMARHQQAARKSNSSPLPRLIDLVKPREEKFRVAFYHALRDTLVADEIQQASKVAYNKNKRWRVVTLQGEVIDTSGTMSGGGSKVFRGRMGSNFVSENVSAEEIEKLQKANDKLFADLQAVKGDIAAYEEDLSTLDDELRQNKTRMQMLSREVANNQSMQKSLRQQLPELEKNLCEARPDASRLSTLEKDAATRKKKHEVVAKDAEAIEKKKDAIHDKICQANEKKLKPLREKLSYQSQQIDELSKKITKLKVSANTAKRNFDKCERSIDNLQNEIKENTESIEELEKEWKELEVDGASVVNALEKCKEEEKRISEELHAMQSDLKRLEGEEVTAAENLKKLKQTFERVNADCLTKLDKVKDCEEQISKLKLHEIDGETAEELRTFPVEELEEVEDDLRARITVLDSDISAMQPNMAAIEEYDGKQNIYLQRVAELDKVTEKRDKYRSMHDQLRKNRLNDFSEGFSIITNKLKEIYQMITLGGDAELEFVDSLDPFSEGIVFSVRPPKKSWKNICNLSGGEKTLSSLALVFALHHYRPTPLYVMDEIDAALDFKNVTIIARYIIERTKNAQFIIISLRNNMFEVADRLVGIYKTDNCTKSATIEPALIAGLPTAEAAVEETPS